MISIPERSSQVFQVENGTHSAKIIHSSLFAYLFPLAPALPALGPFLRSLGKTSPYPLGLAQQRYGIGRFRGLAVGQYFGGGLVAVEAFQAITLAI